MEEKIYTQITWEHLKSQCGEDLDKTFEYLCAAFLQIKFNLPIIPALGGDTYPGTEGPPTLGLDNLLYGFQAKFSEDSYVKKQIIDSCDKICDGTQVLTIFTKDNYPKPKKGFTGFDINNIKKQKEWWDAYVDYLKGTNKDIKEVYFFAGETFLNELRNIKYGKILHKFFPIDDIKKDLYLIEHNPDDINKSTADDEIRKVINGFSGEKDLYEQDLKRAEHIQRNYTYQKLAYCAAPYIFQEFEDMENSVLEKTKIPLALYDYENLEEFTDRGIKEIEEDNNLRNKYKIVLENLISSPKGIFVNYGTKGLSFLEYKKRKKITFNLK